jgi:NADH-quinone oxidoreductase subunit G
VYGEYEFLILREYTLAETAKQNTKKDLATVTLTIDGRELTVPKGTTVLEAARSIGIHIPTFCWHPKLKSVGACRMCYVEIEKMPKLQVSCATEAMEGMVVHTDSDQVKRGRRAVIEFILINHPLDCPTCDKGGECELQNLTFAHGFDDSRFDFQKYRYLEEGVDTTFDDLRIGPEIILNRNRCILCYKCVRANKEAFGEYDLGAYERGNITEINAAPGQQVDNPFSGNLVEICPVGALTNTDWRYKIRVWLTQTVSSICPYTSSGSNIRFFKESHQNRVFRVTGRRNDDIDDGWLPDVTRYGYQIIHSEDRLKTPLIKKEGKQVPATWQEAMDLIGRRLRGIVDKKGCVCIGGLVDPLLDNATLHSFSKLIRVSLGSNNIDFRTDYRMLPKKQDNHYRILTFRPFRISDIDDSDVIVTFGTDLLKEHPNEYLRIRKACNFHNSRVFVLNPYATKQADLAERELVYNIGRDEAVMGALCLAAAEDNLVSSEEATRLREAFSMTSAVEAARAAGVDLDDIKTLAQALLDARKVTFIGGELVSRSKDRESVCAALCNLNRVFGIEAKGQIAVLPRYANSKGAEKLGVIPHPDDQIRAKLEQLWGQWPEAEPCTTDKMMLNMRKEEVDGFIIMGANPIMLYPDREFARESLEKLDFLVACDVFETETTELADVVLPLSTWAEYDGAFVNLEGQVQRTYQAIKPIHESKPGYEILEMIAETVEVPLFESREVRDREISGLLALETTQAWPDHIVDVEPGEDERDDEYPIPLVIGDDPHHCGYRTEKAPSLVNFCGEAYVEISADLAEELEILEGDPVRVESAVGKVVAPARVSEYLDRNIVFMPRNFTATPVTSLLMRKLRVDRVRISKVVT